MPTQPLRLRELRRSGLPPSGRMDRRAIRSTLLVLMCAIGFPPERVPALSATAASVVPRCVGDCDGDGRVTIDEIVTGVNVALGSLSLDRCPSFDCDGNAAVPIDCLIAAVIAALNGCGPPATVSSPPAATATPTMTPSTASRFVDNGDGTIGDTQTGLSWEMKDQSGGVHDVNSLFPWTSGFFARAVRSLPPGAAAARFGIQGSGDRQ